MSSSSRGPISAARLGRPVRTLLQMGWRDRVAVVEAIALSLVAAAGIRLLSFRRIAAWMGEVRAPQDETGPIDAHVEAVGEVRRAVRVAERRVPWPCSCFEQAVVARAMLGRRGVPGEIRFGLTKATGDLEGHAWVRADGRMVTGAIGLDSYATVSAFAFGSESTVTGHA